VWDTTKAMTEPAMAAATPTAGSRERKNDNDYRDSAGAT
jgi:hypothetical protein